MKHKMQCKLEPLKAPKQVLRCALLTTKNVLYYLPSIAYNINHVQQCTNASESKCYGFFFLYFIVINLKIL